MGRGQIVIEAKIHRIVSAESAAFENYVEAESVELFLKPSRVHFFELGREEHIHRGVLYANHETDYFGEIANCERWGIDDFRKPFVEVVEGTLL